MYLTIGSIMFSITWHKLTWWGPADWTVETGRHYSAVYLGHLAFGLSWGTK